jgi:hypothetical protein
MPKYRVELTRLHTRVYYIEAESPKDAEAQVMDDRAEADEDQSYHSGAARLEIFLEEEGDEEENTLTQ